MRPQAESQRFQVDTAAVDGVQLVTVLFQMGRKDIVDVAGNADSRRYHGKQGTHPFIVLTADIGLPALFHNVVAEQMFGILLKTVLFRCVFSRRTGDGASSSPPDTPEPGTSTLSDLAGIPDRFSVSGFLSSSFWELAALLP